MVPPLQYHMNNPADYVNLNQKLFCICGIDPGFLNGHKLVVLDSNEKLVHRETVYYHKDHDTAIHKLKSICESFGIRVISIGNGTGSIEVIHNHFHYFQSCSSSFNKVNSIQYI